MTSDEAKQRSFMQMAKLSSVGLEMGVAVVIGWGIGYWLDGKLGTQPWLMILFFFLGVAAGFKGMLRAAAEASRRSKESKG